MKKLVSLILCLVFLTINVPLAYGQAEPQIIANELDQGIISILYPRDATSKIKVMIEKDNTKLYYNLSDTKESENFPLQLGNGTYKVTVLENISDNRYKTIAAEQVNLNLTDGKQAFLQSVQSIKWDKTMQPIKKAQALTQGLKSDREKAEAIHRYIYQNLQYDYDKISRLTSDYLPDIEQVFATNLGICYDYAALLAAMLRSVGVPVKLVKGYTENAAGYHAWNEVYIDRQWQVVDATYDAELYAQDKQVSLIKDADLYQAKLSY